MNRFNRLIAGIAGLILTASTPLRAQESVGGRSEVFAGSVLESYLRYLGTVGDAKPQQWSVRGFSPREIEARSPIDSTHPWARRYSFSRDSLSTRIDYVRPTVQVIENTSFPFGANDGPVWAGKGLTTVLQAGIAAEWGPLSLKIAPIAFRAQNSSFPLYPNKQEGNLIYGWGQFTNMIDLPQRFGNGAYTRLDPGESTLQVEAAGATAGVSTASQWWGPTDVFPYVLGNNAGGFPHVFFGTAKPANLRIIRLHLRAQYGVLQQSAYSSVTGSENYVSANETGRRRYMAGLVGVMQVGKIQGFEVGGARFFHAPSEGGFSSHDFGLPFQALFRRSLPVQEGKENQLGSLFVRWTPPRSGFDIYGEYGREDFSADTRDALLEPDHAATTNIGIRKAWKRGENLNAVKAEFFNYEASAGARTRFEGFVFIHGILHQGHTYRGQLLSAGVGPGSGTAQSLGYERFSKTGRMSFTFSRITQYEDRSDAPIGPTIDPATDVMNSLGTEITRFIGPLDVTGRFVFTRELNRYLKNDASNGNFALIVRQSF